MCPWTAECVLLCKHRVIRSRRQRLYNIPNDNLHSRFIFFSSGMEAQIRQYRFSSVCFNVETFLSISLSSVSWWKAGGNSTECLWEGDAPWHLGTGSCRQLGTGGALWKPAPTGRAWCPLAEPQPSHRTPGPLCDHAGSWQRQNHPIIKSEDRQNMTIAKATMYQMPPLASEWWLL